MKLLLDTHIWIWSLQASDQLGKRAAQEIKNPENERWVSPVSTWEALTLNAKGRLDLPDDISAWVARATAPLVDALLSLGVQAVGQSSWGPTVYGIVDGSDLAAEVAGRLRLAAGSDTEVRVVDFDRRGAWAVRGAPEVAPA